MSNNNKTPAIRFKGFTNTWEQRKLGEIYSFQYGEFNNNPDNGGVYPIYGANGIIGGYTEYNAEDSAVIGHMGAYAGYVVWAEGKHFVTYNGTIAKPSDNTTDSKYGFYLLSSKQIYRICAGSGQPFVSYNDLNNIDVVIPKAKEEQRKIGNYFSHLDSLITLHQRKCDKLIQFKAAMLQKMFPQNGADKPEIRFKGFTDAWEQRELRTAATFSKGSGYSKNDLEENGTPIILYGRLYTKYETVISEVDTFVDVQPNSVYSTGHEVIVPASGETAEDISRASFVAKSGILLGGDLNIIVPDDYINPVFLALTISNGNQQKELSKRAQGKSVVHIHNSDLENVVLLYPKYEEQKKSESIFQSSTPLSPFISVSVINIKA